MIADLHCDLLLYLSGGRERSPVDSICRCSIPQMRAGGVKLQILPIFTPTGPNSVACGKRQNEIFHALPLQFPGDYAHVTCQDDVEIDSKHIAILRAIENASAFCDENEPLEKGLGRLSGLIQEGPLAYISLTWNTPNRFGGECGSGQGLKADGRSLLQFLSQKKIAVDVSHASDHTAYDIIDYIDSRKLHVPIIASHSNCRAVTQAERNLPDGLIQEIIARQGIIGMNFVRKFVGTGGPRGIYSHMAHILQLQGGDHLSFGADFFFEEDIPLESRRPNGEYFFEELGNASCYGYVLELCSKVLGMPPWQLENISYRTAVNFLCRSIL